jgi:RNA polymerase sigma-70 factor (ECF subfamily)
MESAIRSVTDWPVARSGSRSGDAELVTRAQAGDQSAFREIVERYQAKVMSFINRFLHNRDDAEDVAQEVFASAFFALRNFRLESTLTSWLYRIAVNESFEYLRRKRARPLVFESELSEEAARAVRNHPRAQGAALDTVLARRQMVLKLLHRLSADDRSLLLMREVEGYTMEEIAEITGRSVSAVKVRLFRVRRKLAAAARRGL